MFIFIIYLSLNDKIEPFLKNIKVIIKSAVSSTSLQQVELLFMLNFKDEVREEDL